MHLIRTEFHDGCWPVEVAVDQWRLLASGGISDETALSCIRKIEAGSLEDIFSAYTIPECDSIRFPGSRPYAAHYSIPECAATSDAPASFLLVCVCEVQNRVEDEE